MAAYNRADCIYEGRQSRVHLGVEVATGRSVVLKQLRKLYPSPEWLARFSREFEITKSAVGPHVIIAHDMQVQEGTASIILEDFGARSVASTSRKRRPRWGWRPRCVWPFKSPKRWPTFTAETSSIRTSTRPTSSGIGIADWSS